MKIKDEVKGISYDPWDVPAEYYEEEDKRLAEYYSTHDPSEEPDYLQMMFDNNEQAQINWEKQGEENIKILLAKQKPLVEQFKRKQAIAKSKNEEITYSGESFIGERIEFLMKKNNQEIAEFCRNVGMSRSSLHRYIKGSHLPSEKSLRKIIEGLYVSVADFCYEPNSFEEWKKAFEKTSGKNDIFKFRDSILRELRINSFTYQNNGVTMRLPNRYYELFRNLVKQSFEILELLPHDK